MKITALYIIFCIVFFTGCVSRSDENKSAPIRIIFDTDLGVDDVGALAFLHSMADSGKVEILATVTSNKHQLVAPAIEVINTYFGHGDIPIGVLKSSGVSLKSSGNWVDTIVSRYPHRIKSAANVTDAVSVYRKILAGQPDSSVTIVIVGFLTNLSNLLKSPSDTLSPLNGIELVSAKVKRVVAMAGKYPEGKEFNLFMDSTSSEYVLNQWPGEIIFTGYGIGSEILTGLRLLNSDIRNSPVKDAYRISLPLSEEGNFGRMSWDQTAVLIAVYGTVNFFETRCGDIMIKSDGTNSWIEGNDGKHSYVILKKPIDNISEFIEDRMMHVPMDKK